MARKPDNVVHHRIAVRNTRRSLSALAAKRSRRSSIDRLGRRRLRQCDVREFLHATLECELIDRRRFRSHSEARMAVFPVHQRGFYNPSRRHSALGYLFAHRIRKETRCGLKQARLSLQPRPPKRGNSTNRPEAVLQEAALNSWEARESDLGLKAATTPHPNVSGDQRRINSIQSPNVCPGPHRDINRDTRLPSAKCQFRTE